MLNTGGDRSPGENDQQFSDFIKLCKSLMFIPTSKNRDKGDVDGKLIAPLGFDPHHHLLRCYQKSDLSVMRTLITLTRDRH